MYTAILLLSVGAPDCGCAYSAQPVGLLGRTCTCKLCECGEKESPVYPIRRGMDYDAEAALALALASRKPAVAVVPDVVVQPTTRPGNIGDGHTHTCANGHTWNHATHAGHDCPTCGLSQFIQDPSPRAVNLGYKTLSVASSPCASGNCPAPQKTGLFGRRR